MKALKLSLFRRVTSRECGRIIHTETEHYYEFPADYIEVLLKAKVHPKLITEQAELVLRGKFHYNLYRDDQLRLLKAGIQHLFSTLKKAAEIKRDFEAYDDYAARESTFVTLINIEQKRREESR